MIKKYIYKIAQDAIRQEFEKRESAKKLDDWSKFYFSVNNLEKIEFMGLNANIKKIEKFVFSKIVFLEIGGQEISVDLQCDKIDDRFNY